LTKDELLAIFKAAHDGPTLKEGELTVGLVSIHRYTHWKSIGSNVAVGEQVLCLE
jgi:hypothetical protein